MYNAVEIKDAFKIKAIYSAFNQTRKKDYYFRGERHKLWELVIVCEGKLGVTAGSDAFILSKGQAIIHEPWEFHRVWGEGIDSRIIIFTFHAENMPEYTSNIFEIEDLDIPDNIIDKIYSAFKGTGSKVTKIVEENTIECQIAIKELEIFILKTIRSNFRKSDSKKTRTAKNYAIIINTLENNLDKNLTVDDIAKLCNMSKVNLEKTFARYAGKGVISYFNEMKINTAVPMLKSSMSIKEISEILGFANQNYFCTVFKRIKGKAPTYYR